MPVKRPGVNWEDVPVADLLATPEELAASYKPPVYVDEPWMERARAIGRWMEEQAAQEGVDVDIWLDR